MSASASATVCAHVLTLVGEPVVGGLCIIGDHACGDVPDSVDLRISPALLATHIAVDIGVAEVAAILAQELPNCWAMLARISRLVVDLNREEDHAGLIPVESDGTAIPGNAALDSTERHERITQYFRPYHHGIAAVLSQKRPSMILALHSFTPELRTEQSRAGRRERRPWDIGVLYNHDERLVAPAIEALTGYGWIVGDQKPYSGKAFNATMDRHAEANGISYLGIEMRQDHCSNPTGLRQMVDSLLEMLEKLERLKMVEIPACAQGAGLGQSRSSRAAVR